MKQNGRTIHVAEPAPQGTGNTKAYHLTPDEREEVMRLNRERGLAHLVKERNEIRESA